MGSEIGNGKNWHDVLDVSTASYGVEIPIAALKAQRVLRPRLESKYSSAYLITLTLHDGQDPQHLIYAALFFTT